MGFGCPTCGSLLANTHLPGCTRLGAAELRRQHPQRVVIDYTNYRGERAERTIIPERIEFKATQYHPERQWILLAVDVTRMVGREFALKDIHSWRPA